MFFVGYIAAPPTITDLACANDDDENRRALIIKVLNDLMIDFIM
jgi:hypothetical protein